MSNWNMLKSYMTRTVYDSPSKSRTPSSQMNMSYWNISMFSIPSKTFYLISKIYEQR